MIYLLLFWEFFKTGLFTMGGGLASLPFLYDISDRYGWFSRSTLADMIAVSESTPGPIGINMATYAGFHTAGIPGALAATLGLSMPSVLIILLFSGLIMRYRERPVLKSVFYGLRPAVAAMIAAAGFQIAGLSFLHADLFFKTGNPANLFDIKPLLLFIALAAAPYLIRKRSPHPVVYIAAAAAAGVLLRL